jgi:hypothetical protein
MVPDGFTYLPNEIVLRIFVALKNSSSSAGLEPVNLGSNGKHATNRPSRVSSFSVDVGYRFLRSKVAEREQPRFFIQVGD